MLKNFSILPQDVACLLSDQGEDHPLGLVWTSVGCRNRLSIWEWVVLWEWKPVNTGLAHENKRNSSTAFCLTPLFRQLSSSLKLWFPGSCWSSSKLLSLNFAQHWFCQISSLTSTLFHSFHTHFCPSVLLAHIWEEWPPNLPVGSQCTVGYFHRRIYQIPLCEDGDGRVWVRCAHSLYLQSSAASGKRDKLVSFTLYRKWKFSAGFPEEPDRKPLIILNKHLSINLYLLRR